MAATEGPPSLPQLASLPSREGHTHVFLDECWRDAGLKLDSTFHFGLLAEDICVWVSVLPGFEFERHVSHGCSLECP